MAAVIGLSMDGKTVESTKKPRGDHSLPHDVVVLTAMVDSTDLNTAPGVLCHGYGGENDHSNRLPNKVEHEVPTVESAVVEGVASYDPDAHEGRTLTEKSVKCGSDVFCPGLTKFAGPANFVMGYCFRVVA